MPTNKPTSERDIVTEARELESVHVDFHETGRVCRTCSTLHALADEVERMRLGSCLWKYDPDGYGQTG